MTDIEVLESLLGTLVELSKLRSEPGEKSHALWNTTDRVWRLIVEVVRRPAAQPAQKQGEPK